METIVLPPLVLPPIPVVTHMAHWPTGPVRVCAKHADGLKGLADVLGFHLHVEDLEDETTTQCMNCLQELAVLTKDHP